MGRFIKLILTTTITLCLCFLYSCSKYRFAKGGVFVDDVDKYFNPDLHLNIWLYADFYPYSHKINGIRLNSYYSMDKDVLKIVNFKTKKNNLVLFSGLPSSQPQYNLIAIKHAGKVKSLNGYQCVQYNGAKYYFKDFRIGKIDIRHAYIPIPEQQGLSLIYYINSDFHQACKFCKIDYLANINAEELQISKRFNKDWRISEQVEDSAQSVWIAYPEELLNQNKRLFMKVSAQYDNQVGINYFHIYDKGDQKLIPVDLVQGTYYVDFFNSNHKILKTDTLRIN